jgi:trehalose/maltose transport system permease protein
MSVLQAEKEAIVPPAGTQRPPRRRTTTALQSKQTRLAWLLMSPTIAVVVLVAAYPLIRTFINSFTDAAFGAPTIFIGWTNYYNLLHDVTFWQSVLETFKFTIITVSFEFVLGMGIALVVNSRFKGRGALRAAMLVPWAVVTVVNAQMWLLMFNASYGVFNDILLRLHWPGAPISFLTDPNIALASISSVDIWKTTPFVALLLLAGLQIIPNDVYEAATVDGASAWQQFWRITLPLLKPAILVTLIFRTMDALRVFDVFYVFFGDAPCIPGNCLKSMAVYEQSIGVNGASTSIPFSNYGGIGYGAALSVGIFVILAVVIAIYIKAIPLER